MMFIITTCKGRLDQLKKMVRSLKESTMPMWNLIIVDYGCPDGTAEWVKWKQDEDRRIFCVKAPDGLPWNLSAARNLGIAAIPDSPQHIEQIVIFADADTIFKPQCLEHINYQMNLQRDTFITGEPNCSGNCVVWTNQLREVIGYDGNFVGWGAEDVDFYIRMTKSGFRKKQIYNPADWSYQDHTDQLRTKYQSMSKTDSQKANVKRLFEKHNVADIVPEYIPDHLLHLFK